MDAKRIAMVLAIIVLLPLFVGLFADAAYQEPKYENYCNDSYNNGYNYPAKAIPTATNCTYVNDPSEQKCYADGGIVRYNYTSEGCSQFGTCDMCSKNFNTAQQTYNRNLFFILLPTGLAIVIVGIYLVVDYLGAGLMFAGLIVMFYATFRYFSDMSKVLRALVILVELLVIMWIGYKKIEEKRKNDNKINKPKNPARKK
jgi:hypothetical protein